MKRLNVHVLSGTNDGFDIFYGSFHGLNNSIIARIKIIAAIAKKAKQNTQLLNSSFFICNILEYISSIQIFFSV